MATYQELFSIVDKKLSLANDAYISSPTPGSTLSVKKIVQLEG